MSEDYIWSPEDDGVTHINVYSKGKTELGRWLTNFATSPFEHPVHGSFVSMEGFWYWLRTGMKVDAFRTLNGWDAKKLGKVTTKVEMDQWAFQNNVKFAIRCKLLAHPKMLNKLLDTTLPLGHYYVYGGKAVHAGYEWITEFYEEVRSACHLNNWRPQC